MYDPTDDVRATLAAYLADATLGLDAALTPDLRGVKLLNAWPNPRTKLEARTVAVVVPEQVADVRYWSPAVFDLTEDAPGAVTGRVRYSFGRFKVSLQLDVWAAYEAQRKALVAALNTVLHRHPAVTMPGGDGYARPGRWHELIRPATDLPGSLIVYRFNDVPSYLDSGASSPSGEFRATLTGEAYGVLTTEEAAGILRSITLVDSVTDASGTATDTTNLTED